MGNSQIQSLPSVKELFSHLLNFQAYQGLSVDFPTTGPPRYEAEIKRLIISSCHRTLVFLGDLSRYREVSQNPKNWGPATGYYTLAKKLVPTSGSPHNQLAVIALNEGSNFSATYHLYRALSVAEPFPEAGDNLGVGFRKVLKAYKAGNLTANLARKEEQVIHELVALFVRLHAKCFIGKELVSSPLGPPPTSPILCIEYRH